MAVTISGSDGIDIGGGNLTFADDSVQSVAATGLNETFGGVGTYVFARINGTTDLSGGGVTVAGSTLYSTSVQTYGTTSINGNTGILGYSATGSTQLSGTWRLMGALNDQGSAFAYGASLFLRIA